MAYIGRQNLGGAYRQLDDISSGFDGSDTTHTMQVNSQNVTVGDVNQIILSLGGVIQKPGTDFTVSGSVLTFTTAPATNTSFFAILLGSDNGGTVTPTDGSVTGDKIASNLSIATNVTITTADNTDTLTLKSTDADANVGPVLNFNRDSSSPADSDFLGSIDFQADNDAGDTHDYIRILSRAIDVSDGAEEADLIIKDATGNNIVNFSHTQVVYNEDSVDRDFRVEGNGDTHLLHCDAGGDHVNIKTGSSDLSTSLGIGGSGERALFIYQALNQDTVVATWKNVFANGSNSATMIQFTNSGNTEVGSIKSTGSATAYNTSSDYRLKENVDYTWDATSRLKQLKPARFNWIADDTNTLEDGFLAHEVSSIVPEAITGTKDAATTLTKAVIGEHGNVIAQNIEESAWTAGKADGTYDANTTWHASKVDPIYQQIDLGKLVPLLVKTVQEQEARIKALEDA